MNRRLILLSIILFFLPIINALDLSDYPGQFIKDNVFYGFLVVGDKAPAEDVIAVSDIAVSLQNYQGQRINVGATRLSFEIEDIYAQNLLVVGNPCNNKISSELMGNPSNCLDGLKSNKGLIKLTKKNGYYQLLVAGYSNKDTRDAARVLSNYKNYDFKGTEIEITKNSDGSFSLEFSGFEKKDLSDFPGLFVKDGNLNAFLVVGNSAPSSDVIAQTELALFFGQQIGKPAIGYTNLADEISSLDQNLISIGSPCHNKVSAKIMGYPEPCDKDIEKNKAYIKLYNNDEFTHMVVLGHSNKGTREAVKVLTHFNEYDLNGVEFELDVEEEISSQNTGTEIEDIEEVESIEDDVQIEIESEQENKKIETDSKATNVNKAVEDQKSEEIISNEDATEEIPQTQKKENIFIKFISWIKSIFS